MIFYTIFFFFVIPLCALLIFSGYQRNFKSIIMRAIVMFMLIATTCYAGVQQMQLPGLHKQEKWFEHRIQISTSRYDALMRAMVNIRAVRSEGQEQCSNSAHTRENTAYQTKLIKTYYKLVGVTYETKITFDNAINQKISSFETDVSIHSSGICATGAATDKDLLVKQSEIQELILNSIYKLKEQKNAIAGRIENITAV